MSGNYTFERSASDNEQRFRLHFYAPPHIDVVSACDPHAGTIRISNPADVAWEIELVNTAGEKLRQEGLEGNTGRVFEQLPAGSYALKFSHESGFSKR